MSARRSLTSTLPWMVLGVCVAWVDLAAAQNIVQPGAPGQPSRIISAQEAAQQGLSPVDLADVRFMQHMIVHHGQAVEMVGMVAARTSNRQVKLIANRIGLSQSREIDFMKRWLTERGQSTAMPGMASMMPVDPQHPSTRPIMKSMLSPAQMVTLRAAHGATFDRLFLSGMIQHHQGAIDMVNALLATPGAAADPEIARFAGDILAAQRTQIALMQDLLHER